MEGESQLHVPEINVCSNVSFKHLNESSSSFLFGSSKDNYLDGIVYLGEFTILSRIKIWVDHT